MVGHRVGTHKQKQKRHYKIEPAPQRRTRESIFKHEKAYPTHQEAVAIRETISPVFPDAEIVIRKMANGFKLFWRVPIKEKEDAQRNRGNKGTTSERKSIGSRGVAHSQRGTVSRRIGEREATTRV